MAIYQIEDVQLDPNLMELRRGRDVISIEPKSFRVLVHLIEHRNRVVPKEELIERIWSGAAVTDNALTRVVAQIRKALGDDARQSRFIETVPTVGYRFIGPVEELTNATIGEPLDPNPKINWWVPLIAVSAIALAFLMPYIRFWTSSNPPAPRAMQFTSSSGLDTHPSFSPDGSSIAYASDKGGKFEIYVRQVQPGGTEVAITSDGKENLEPAWSPDGSQVAYFSALERGIFAVSSLGGQPRRLTTFGSQPTWSKDSKRIAFRSEGLTSLAFPEVFSLASSTIWWIAAEGGEPERLTEPGQYSGKHSQPRFSPKSDHLAFLNFQLNRTASIWEMDIRTRQTVEVLKGPPHAYEFTYAADGASLYFAGFEDQALGLYLLKRDPVTRKVQGKPQLLTPVEYVHLRDLAVNPKGDRLAYTATSITSNLWQTHLDGRTEPLTQENSYRTTQPVFSPDGSKIAYFARRKGVLGDIFVIDADGKNPRQITRDPGQDYMASWTPDGERVLYVSIRGGRASINQYSFQDGTEKPFAVLDSRKSMARVSPDATKLAYHRDADGRMSIWVRDIASEQEKQINVPEEMVGFPAWSPDGKSIAAELREGDYSHAVILPVEGGKSRRLTNRPGHAWVFSFSPDGRKIPITAFWDEPWNIHIYNLDDGKLRKLTSNKLLRVFLRYPAWSPDGSRIVYEHCETKGNLFLANLNE